MQVLRFGVVKALVDYSYTPIIHVQRRNLDIAVLSAPRQVCTLNRRYLSRDVRPADFPGIQSMQRRINTANIPYPDFEFLFPQIARWCP